MNDVELQARGLGLIAVVVAGCLAALVFDAAGRRVPAALAKVGGSAGFVGLAYVSGAAGVPAGMTLVLALVLSLAGDAALIGRTRVAFLTGLFFFLLGHVAFAVAFASRELAVAPAAVAAVVVLVPSVLFERWLAPRTGPLRPAVAAYIVVLGIMLSLAVGAGVGGASPLLPLGAALFWLSDACVAWNRFVQPAAWTRRVGLPLYYAGQVLIVIGFRLLVVTPA